MSHDKTRTHTHYSHNHHQQQQVNNKLQYNECAKFWHVMALRPRTDATPEAGDVPTESHFHYLYISLLGKWKVDVCERGKVMTRSDIYHPVFLLRIIPWPLVPRLLLHLILSSSMPHCSLAGLHWFRAPSQQPFVARSHECDCQRHITVSVDACRKWMRERFNACPQRRRPLVTTYSRSSINQET